MLTPVFKIEYNEKNITKDVSYYVLSIEYSDYEHGQSDEITITFEDTQELWQNAWIPSKGDTLKLDLRCENKEQAILKAKAALDKGNNTSSPNNTM